LNGSVENWQVGGFGLYLHWPFCASKCPYCDFNSHVSGSIDQDRWKAAYLAEIDRYAAETTGRVLDSIYFGGGTPSLMEPGLVHAILERINAHWTPANNIEITLEANPTSVEAGRFAGYRDAGVNRVSVGVQALNNTDLRNLGRLHTVEEALSALEIARATFERVNFDLIYARQHQSLQDWRRELASALALAPDHLSLYQLTVEQNTAFGERLNRGKLLGLPDEDLGADMYFHTQQVMEDHGLPAYEVSNHAKTGLESRHNNVYWRSGDYVGIGPGAHGRLTFGGTRLATETPLDPRTWLEAVEAAGTGESGRATLSPDDRGIEFLMMGLRIREGISLRRLQETGFPALSSNKINMLEDSGLIQLSDDTLAVTAQGRPLLNAIIRELIPD